MDIKVKGPAPSQEVLAAISEKQVGMKKAFAENDQFGLQTSSIRPTHGYSVEKIHGKELRRSWSCIKQSVVHTRGHMNQ